jgi:hypothetical protein
MPRHPLSRISSLPLILLLIAGCPSGSLSSADSRVDHGDAGPVPDSGPRDADSGTGASDSVVSPEGPPVAPALPEIQNFSGATAARAEALVKAAIDGLGFPTGSDQGPNKDDLFFVGRYYIVWIDQTGFYGKMNGLWRLDGAAGDALEFVLREPDGRPVNFLVPGEDGDGRWPAGYPGGEHVEFPNRNPEPNDDPGCATRDWCNQYGLNEAPQITDPDIPWWSACNAGTPAWSTTFAPVVKQQITSGLKLVYEGPLVKEADGDGNHDGDACHQDYLFPDGQRRGVFLRVGYELFGDKTHLDRTMQLRNPAGNPALPGAMSLIGGFVMTRFPNPHYLKQLDRYLRPEMKDVGDPMHGITLKSGTWNTHIYDASPQDEVFGWLDQPISMSPAPQYVEGRSATLDHVGPSDNQDVGICLCVVHGGIEMGGGLIHAGISLPINGGSSSIEARRRLTLPGTGGPGEISSFVYEAETDLLHTSGEQEPDGWSATVGEHQPGYMVYGPHAATWGDGSAQAVFYLMLDTISADNMKVVTLDIHDATAQQILVTREVRSHDLRAPMTYQRFAVTVDLPGRSGHTMEARVNWHGEANVRLDKVTVNTAD